MTPVRGSSCGVGDRGPGSGSPGPRPLPLAVQGPLLVGLAVAGPENDLRTVRGTGPVGVHAQSRLDTGDGAVGVHVPLLVGLAVAVPDDYRRAVGRTLTVGVQALVAEHHQLLARRVGPPLVAVAAAVPQLH